MSKIVVTSFDWQGENKAERSITVESDLQLALVPPSAHWAPLCVTDSTGRLVAMFQDYAHVLVVDEE